MNEEANVFCKCGGVRKSFSPGFLEQMGWRKCVCVTPERSWAAKTWIQRANAWLHEEPHDLELDGKDVVYHVNGYENGFKVAGRTLSQMSDIRAECYTPVLRRKNFLHEMGR
jgi:hypothetical protein